MLKCESFVVEKAFFIVYLNSCRLAYNKTRPHYSRFQVGGNEEVRYRDRMLLVFLFLSRMNGVSIATCLMAPKRWIPEHGDS